MFVIDIIDAILMRVVSVQLRHTIKGVNAILSCNLTWCHKIGARNTEQIKP